MPAGWRMRASISRASSFMPPSISSRVVGRPLEVAREPGVHDGVVERRRAPRPRSTCRVEHGPDGDRGRRSRRSRLNIERGTARASRRTRRSRATPAIGSSRSTRPSSSRSRNVRPTNVLVTDAVTERGVGGDRDPLVGVGDAEPLGPDGLAPAERRRRRAPASGRRARASRGRGRTSRARAARSVP